jgi:urease accessory protein
MLACLSSVNSSVARLMSWKNKLWFRTEPMFDNVASPVDRAGESNAFNLMDRCVENPSDRSLQRAEGSCRIVLGNSGKGTRIVDVYERAPIRVLFPRMHGCVIEEAVLINTAGGVAGGDRFESSVTALANASIVVTSQAAEKVYRALKDPARIRTKLKVHEAAKLAWLPQETIVFNCARLIRETEIEFSSGAELIALEWLVLGRAAHGEQMTGGHITDSWYVKKDGRLIWADSFRIADETFPQLCRQALLSNYKAIGTLVYFGPDVDARLQFLRDIVPTIGCQCAATAVAGLIVVRFAAKASFDLRLALRDFIEQFGRHLQPGPFRVPKMWSC